MACFTWLVLLGGFILVMLTLLRWFEQITEAVERRWWNKVFVLLIAPFAVWFFPGRIAAGRPTPVPHHEPIRGFGLSGPGGPPPGTRKEFLELPKVPAGKPKTARASEVQEKMEKLKQKMRDQGMLGPEE